MNIRTALLLAVGVALPAMGHAQEIQQRRSPLADAPAIRKRSELRAGRFELGVGVGSTIGQDFYHAVVVGPKLAFHLNDWLALSAFAQVNVTKDYKSSFTNELTKRLDDMPRQGDRTPQLTPALEAMNKVGQVFGVQAEFIPFTGKLALFNALFASYDFYAFGGLGGINFTADGPSCAAGEMSAYCPVTGVKLGATFGLGMRTFVKDWFALNFEVRDVLLRNNPAGRDVNGDRIVTDDDLSFDSNFIVGLNFVFFLPATPKISD